MKKKPKEIKPDYAQIYHADLWGLREIWEKNPDGSEHLVGGKYHYLNENNVSTTPWKKLRPQTPLYLFVPQDIRLSREYEKGWKITEVMPVNSVGIVTARDSLTIHFNKDTLLRTIKDFIALPPEKARYQFNLGNDTRDWKIPLAQQDIQQSGLQKSLLVPVLYRPFDQRWTYYTGQTRGFICMPRPEVMRHMLAGKNVGLIFMRQVALNSSYTHFLATRFIIDNRAFYSNKGIMSLAPLYLYPQSTKDGVDLPHTGEASERVPNLAAEFIEDFSRRLHLSFIADGKGDLKRSFGPEDIFHYLYALFHSPTYRNRYGDFLKRDFPRLPLTSNLPLFRTLCKFGERLQSFHLLEGKVRLITGYPIPGSNLVEKPYYDNHQQRVYINKKQYFSKVPARVWEHQVGGYQVCAKWLKDRKGRTLSYDDLTHYQQIVSVLNETITLMTEIDQAIEVQGGWPLE